MSARDALTAEAATLCRALTGADPTPALVEAYVAGHAHPSFAARPTRLDEALLSAARGSVAGARQADAYAALLDRRGLLRRKLVLLYALAETLPPHHRVFEAGGVGIVAAVLGLVTTGVAAGVRFGLGLLRFGPVHLREWRSRP